MKFSGGKGAIIVLSEIYGVNEFIADQCQRFRDAGYKVFCPNIIGKPPFPYDASAEAYDFFMNNIGFDRYEKINSLICQLKKEYEKVFVIGFSVGATIAWRCCENHLCDGIVACYGSRIRDYTDLKPVCPMLLILAKEDSYDVQALALGLGNKQQVSVLEFEAGHGFLDPYSECYSERQSKCAEEAIDSFLIEIKG